MKKRLNLWFEGFYFHSNQQEKEAGNRWGDQPVNKMMSKLESMTKDEHKYLSEKWEMIFNKLETPS